MNKCIICNSLCSSWTHAGCDLLRCRNCDHIFQQDLTTLQHYDKDYIFDYFEHNSLRQMSLLRAGFVESCCNKGNILDFGFGSGDFLRVMRKLDWDVFGHDVHQLDLGIKNLTKDEILNQHWSVITFFDSLEHLENFEFIEKLKLICDNFIVSIPARPSTFPDQTFRKESWKHFKPGEHLHYFSDGSLDLLFSGFNRRKKSCVEDAVRGKLKKNVDNIHTFHYQK